MTAKKVCLILVPLLVLLFMSSCAPRNDEKVQMNLRGSVFGTYYTITYFVENGQDFQPQIDSIFRAFNESLSYFVSHSLITRINNNLTDTVDDLFRVVYLRSYEIFEATQGAFDPTVSPLVNAWGFGFAERMQLNPKLVDSLKGLVGLNRTQLQGNRIIKEDPRIQFDFNAIAKGYAADVIARWLESKGVTSYLVELGGDLIVGDLKPDGTPWRIALEKPAEQYDDPQKWYLYVEMENEAVATSGNYRRYYEVNGQRFSHTIDPASGYPVTHNLLSASVFARDAITADAYATAFMVMGFENSKAFVENHPELEAFFVYSTGLETYGTFATPGLTILEREDLKVNSSPK
ncbi:MAG TPA: FAD:protein FMN transferase [Bacteroidales bacterium]|nr:FAD:protein FMN transferase [Bacteroidales bacterium]